MTYQHTCPVHGKETCNNPYLDIPFHYCSHLELNNYTGQYLNARNLGWEEPTSKEETEEQETAYQEEQLERKHMEELIEQIHQDLQSKEIQTTLINESNEPDTKTENDNRT